MADSKPIMPRSAKAKGATANAKRPLWRRIAYRLTVLAVWGVIVGTCGLIYFAWDLPDVDQAIQGTRKPTLTILSIDGVQLARRGDVYADPVNLKDLPPAVPQAILATEDRRFYGHVGIDFKALARAMWVNVQAGGIRQGGSTITQQAAKNLFLTPERTYKRKAQEVLLALWLETKFSKDQILTIYLNRVYFGRGVYGIGAASRHYFDVPAKDLSLLESAMLAGMLKGPNKYNPLSNPDLARGRAAVVLDNMVAAGYLKQARADQTKTLKTRRLSSSGPTRPMGRHFADWVIEQVGDFVTPNQDLVVVTSLDSRLQRSAQSQVARMMKAGGPADTRAVGDTALVAIGMDGAVLAMVGGKSYPESKFNRAVQAQRQPGSAFKPVVYMAAMEHGIAPGDIFTDAPLTIDGWSPRNFKNEFLGPLTMAEALTRSINTVAVQVAEEAGRDAVIATARKLGFTSKLTEKPSLALGVSETNLLELTSAYGAFASGGEAVWPYAIVEIQDSAGKTLYQRLGSGPGQVIPVSFAGAMNQMLSDVIEKDFGTGKAARLDRPAAGKTGTSQGYRDAWFIGYTADIIAGVWMGNDNGAPMKGVTGGGFPAHLWKGFMLDAHKGLPKRDLFTQRFDQADDLGSEPPKKQGAFDKIFETIFGK